MTGITQNIWARPERIKNIVTSMDIWPKNKGTIARCNTPAINVDAAAAYNNDLTVKGRHLDYYFFYLFLINYKRDMRPNAVELKEILISFIFITIIIHV
jgi:hypothetical protein